MNRKTIATEKSLPEEAIAPPIQQKPKKRPGKGAQQRKQDNFREKANEKYEKNVIDKRISDWKSFCPVEDVFPQARLADPINCPPVNVPISFECLYDLSEHVAREVAQLIKRPNEYDHIQKTLFLGSSMQLEAKIALSNVNNSNSVILTPTAHTVLNTICTSIDHAPIPLAAYLDCVGKFQFGEQTYYPTIINLERSACFSSLRARGNVFGARFNIKPEDFVVTPEFIVLTRYDLPGYPPEFGLQWRVENTPEVRHLGQEFGFWIIDPLGIPEPTDGLLDNPSRLSGFEFAVDEMIEEQAIVTIVGPDGQPVDIEATHRVPRRRVLSQVECAIAPPVLRGDNIVQFIADYNHLITEIKARSKDVVVPLNLRDGRGSPAQLVGVHNDDGLERVAVSARALSNDAMIYGGILGFGLRTGFPLHALENCYQRATINYVDALRSLAAKVRARIKKE